MTRIIKTEVLGSSLRFWTDDGKDFTITPHAERLFVGVSGLGDKVVKAQQLAANSADLLYVSEEELRQAATPDTKVNRFTEHVPGFVDVEPAAPTLFQDLTELLLVPRLQWWVKQPAFVRFSQSRYPDHALLMAEFSEKFFVAGLLDRPVQDLPEFLRQY